METQGQPAQSAGQAAAPGINPYQAPQAPVYQAGIESAEKLDPKAILFSFQGRLSRKPYWLYFLGVVLIMIVAVGIVSAMGRWAQVLLIPVYIFYVWTGLAIQVKRWHDRNKSGWWVLIALIPLIGPLWAFIEAGCMRGTEGGNDYGPDGTELY